MRKIVITFRGAIFATITVDENATDKEIDEKVKETLDNIIEWEEI